jgi:hypothetical protein
MNSSAAYECAGPSVSPQCPFMARCGLVDGDRCRAQRTPLLAPRHYSGPCRAHRGDEFPSNLLENRVRQLPVGDARGISRPLRPQVGSRPTGKRLASLSTTQERASSSLRRRLVAAGTSTASSGSDGGACVTGSAVTHCSPASSVLTRMTAQGRSLTPSSWPRACSSTHRYA